MRYPSVKTLLNDLRCVQDDFESARLSLNVLVESINRLKNRRNEVDRICREGTDAVRKSRPGNTPLAHLLDFFESDRGRAACLDTGGKRLGAVESLEERIAQLDRYGTFVAENGLAHVNDGDRIFVFQSDQVIENLLIQARTELGLSFKVVLLDHRGEGTSRAGEVLAAAGIDARILAPGSEPEAQGPGAARLFMGGMTVTADRKILAPEGTAEMVDRFRSKGGQVYLFAASLWFARQRSTELGRLGTATGDMAPVVPARDMVSLDRVDHMVTEFGEVGPDGRLIAPPVSKARLKAGDAETVELISVEVAEREMSAA